MITIDEINKDKQGREKERRKKKNELKEGS